MILFDDTWYFPDGETHIPQWMTQVRNRVQGRLRYQGKKYDAAMLLTQRRRMAVDVGAHVGLWSYWMAEDFETLHAFEPRAENRDCWQMNVLADNAYLHGVGLGDFNGNASLLINETSSGNTRIVQNGFGIEIRTLDSYQLRTVDFLKIDCEGYEAFVIEGAMQTIKASHPTIIVEQKPGMGAHYGLSETAAVTLLQSLGYVLVQNMGGDYLMAFPEV